MAVGFTINHIAAVLVPVTGGLIWLADYRLAFLVAAGPLPGLPGFVPAHSRPTAHEWPEGINRTFPEREKLGIIDLSRQRDSFIAYALTASDFLAQRR